MRETLDCFFLPAEFLIFNTLVKSLSIVIRIIFVHLYIYRYIFNFFYKITLFTPLTIQYAIYSTGINMNFTESGLCSTFPKPL